MMSRSGKLEKLIEKYKEDEIYCLPLSDIPGGHKTFELATKFCYGMKLEITPHNVGALQCITNYLENTEDYREGNLLTKVEGFLDQVALRRWKDYVQALYTFDGFIQKAEELQIVRKCVDSLSMKTFIDPNLIGWPTQEQEGLHSPGGSILWNGISTGERHRHPQSDWWYEDITVLSLPLFNILISAMEEKVIREENIAGTLVYYAKKSIPGLTRRQVGNENLGLPLGSVPSKFVLFLYLTIYTATKLPSVADLLVSNKANFYKL